MNDTPFDTFLASMKAGLPVNFHSASINVHDTLIVAWASVLQTLKDKATPELAIEVCKMMLAERARQDSLFPSSMT